MGRYGVADIVGEPRWCAIRSRALVLLLVGCWAVTGGGFAVADEPPAPKPLCTVTEPGLLELSGLASDGRNWFAVGDSGDRVRIVVLNRDCSVARTITAPLDPYDVEDLALARDGSIWLGDTGDNGRDRDTVAVIRVTPGGDTTLYRLTYPNGKRDAEALLLGRNNVPYVVTKSIDGRAEVYRPADRLRSPGPTPLKQVGTVRLESTETPGGPASGFVGSALVTGGAVSRSGNVVALRTYTEAYLYRAPRGDVRAALRSEPLRIPLPNEVQGEAIAIEPDGTLLSAGEGERQPVRAVPDAVRYLPAPETGDGQGEPIDAPGGTESGEGLDTGPAILVAAGVTGLLLLLVRGIGKLRRKR